MSGSDSSFVITRKEKNFHFSISKIYCTQIINSKTYEHRSKNIFEKLGTRISVSESLACKTGVKVRINSWWNNRVAESDPHNFNADPNPGFYFSADLSFWLWCGSRSKFFLSDGNWRSLVYRPKRAPFWASRPPYEHPRPYKALFWASKAIEFRF